MSFGVPPFVGFIVELVIMHIVSFSSVVTVCLIAVVVAACYYCVVVISLCSVSYVVIGCSYVGCGLRLSAYALISVQLLSSLPLDWVT